MSLATPEVRAAKVTLAAHRKATRKARPPKVRPVAEGQRQPRKRERVVREAAHQRDRWGSEHDDGKAPLDWFWLIGYLAQKAATSAMSGDTDKALHHTISTAAALANWHAALTGSDTKMRPGVRAASIHSPLGRPNRRAARAYASGDAKP